MQSNIQQQLQAYYPRIALFKNDSLGVLVASEVFKDEQLIDSLKQQSFEIDGVKQFLNVRILVMQLDAFPEHSAEQIFNLAESTLSEEKSQMAELLVILLKALKQSHAVTH